MKTEDEIVKELYYTDFYFIENGEIIPFEEFKERYPEYINDIKKTLTYSSFVFRYIIFSMIEDYFCKIDKFIGFVKSVFKR